MKSGWTGANHQYEIPEIIAYANFNEVQTSPASTIDIADISDLNWINPNPEFIISFSVENDEISEFEPRKEILELEVKIHGGICTTCIKKKTGSGDVTVQFRALNRKITQQEMDSATTLAFSLASQMTYESQEAYLSDIVESYGGLDFFFGNDAIAENFISGLKKKWIGHNEKNYKLVTEDREERRVYAVTHLFRLPEVHTDDYVEIDGELHQVRHVSKAGVHLLSLRTHSRIISKEWKKLKPVGPSPLLEKMLVVSENIPGNSYLIMDLKNYDSMEYSRDNFPTELELGNEIEFLVWDDKLYLNTINTVDDQNES
jgi:NMD protein affecting ribosome stability and mRNA decay